MDNYEQQLKELNDLQAVSRMCHICIESGHGYTNLFVSNKDGDKIYLPQRIYKDSFVDDGKNEPVSVINKFALTIIFNNWAGLVSRVLYGKDEVITSSVDPRSLIISDAQTYVDCAFDAEHANQYRICLMLTNTIDGGLPIDMNQLACKIILSKLNFKNSYYDEVASVNTTLAGANMTAIESLLDANLWE